jgi:hydrogenase nickel incorporation protein HypB
MCDECGCGRPETTIKLDRAVSEHNDRLAHETWHDLQQKGILCVNLMGAPGSGKTSFIEGLAGHIDPEVISVIQGDLESDLDQKRLSSQGVDTHQINTHSGCHLNADMVSRALKETSLKGKKYLIIENVGNLVCPAGIKLGQHLDVVVSSTTEGPDKPTKYPLVFLDAKLVVISKTDLADAAGFDERQYTGYLRNINRRAQIVRTSSVEPASFKPAAEFFRREHRNLGAEAHAH